MGFQENEHKAKEGIAFRAVSSVLLLAATFFLVGSLISAHSAKHPPNTGQMTRSAAA